MATRNEQQSLAARARYAVVHTRPGHRALIIAACAAGVFGLGYAGFAAADEAGAFNIAYRSLQLFFLEFDATLDEVPLALQIARFLAPILTVALTADAIRALVLYLRDGGVGPFAPREHMVVCGLGRTGAAIARDALTRGRVVAVTREGHAERVRQCQREGVRVIKGDATDPEVLELARAERASRLIVVCGEDGVNADVLGAVVELKVRTRSVAPLAVHVQIEDRQLARMLGAEGSTSRDDGIAVHVFDLPRAVAAAMLRLAHEHRPRAAADEPKGRDVIIGFGTLGQALASEILRTSAATRGDRDTTDTRALVIVDRVASRKCDAFRTRVATVAAESLTPMQIELESGDFEGTVFLDGEPPIDAVFVCTGVDAVSLAAGVHIARRTSAPVIVRIATEHGGLTRMLPPRDNLHFVGMDAIAPQLLGESTPSA